MSNIGLPVGKYVQTFVTCGLGVNVYDPSDWALTDVVIWDRALSSSDMQLVSTNMLFRLCAGTGYWKSGTVGCVACPASSTSTGTTCSCAANHYFNLNTNLCVPCPTGSTSAAGALACTCTTPNYIVSGASCVAYLTYGVGGIKPWGIYTASNYLAASYRLIEAQGLPGRDVTASGTITVNSADTGNGATSTITSIGGGPLTSTMFWASFPTNSSFSICSTTRYTGSNIQRILGGPTWAGSCNFLHGHWGGMRAVAYYNGWVTQSSASIGKSTNWLVMCGQTGGSVPTNIIADGKLLFFFFKVKF